MFAPTCKSFQIVHTEFGQDVCMAGVAVGIFGTLFPFGALTPRWAFPVCSPDVEQEPLEIP